VVSAPIKDELTQLACTSLPRKLSFLVRHTFSIRSQSGFVSLQRWGLLVNYPLIIISAAIPIQGGRSAGEKDSVR